MIRPNIQKVNNNLKPLFLWKAPTQLSDCPEYVYIPKNKTEENLQKLIQQFYRIWDSMMILIAFEEI